MLYHCTTPAQTRRKPKRVHNLLGTKLWSSHLRRSEFPKPSSASLSSLLYPPDQWTKIPAGLHAVAVAMGHVGYGQCTSPSCTRRGKQGKHHRGTTHGTSTHGIAEGMHTGQSGPIGPIRKRQQQTAAVSLGKLNGEQCETRIPHKY